MVRWRMVILSALSFSMVACSRDSDKSTSKIVIQVPQAANKVGAMAAMPTDRKVCYGVSVSGPGIPSNPASTCSPAVGLVAGFVEAGSTVELSVPKGSSRVIDLYSYLFDPGQNLPCPKLGTSLPATALLRTYLVGSASGVEMAGDQTVVEITASFPGLSNHLAQSMSMPSSCTAGAGGGQPAGFYVSAGAGVATGTGYALKFRMGKPSQAQVLSGGSYKLMVK